MKISIITTNFNWAKFIERTLISVLNQKWDFDLEYIITDGGSTDSSIKIIKKIENEIKQWKFKWNQKSLKFIRTSEPDKWQSDGINKWLKKATWNIITYLNSDDIYKPWTLQIISKVLGNSTKQRCYGKCDIIDKKDKEIRKAITIYKNIKWKKYSYKKLLTENFISQMTVFRKKEAMDNIWLFDINQHLVMDYDYRLRLWKLWAPIYIPKYLSSFRFFSTTKSWSNFKKQFAQELQLAHKYAKWQYKLALLLHRINYYKIVISYTILRWLKI